MASFTAELQVAGQRYPVRHCTYEFTQATSERGRVSAKVRHGLVQLTLDVPHDDALLAWAVAEHKPQPGQVVFFDGGGAALETLAWEAGECVGYQETFLSGDGTAGAYVCHLTIAAPQLTVQPGGPAAAVSAAASDHGGPILAAALTSVSAKVLPTGYLRKGDSSKLNPDPVRTLLGPGRLSHPEEWKETIAMLEREGVDITYRQSAMGYWAVPDSPGRLLLDPEMSISALRHETRHFLDDKALGYPGMGYFFNNLDERWKFEFSAYMEEINFVRGIQACGAGHKLIKLARQEKALIYSKE